MILGIRGIEESSVYQDIFAKGEAKGLVEGRVEGRVEDAHREHDAAVLNGDVRSGEDEERAERGQADEVVRKESRHLLDAAPIHRPMIEDEMEQRLVHEK